MFAVELDAERSALVGDTRGDPVEELLEFPTGTKDIMDAIVHLVRYCGMVHPAELPEEPPEGADSAPEPGPARRIRRTHAEQNFTVTVFG
jgi:hypothetical protein